MKLIFSLMLLLAVNCNIFSQNNKIDSYSKHILANYSKSIVNEEFINQNQNDSNIIKIAEVQNIRCLIKVKDNSIESIIDSLGAKILVKAGDVWGVEIPFSKINSFIQYSELLKLSISQTNTLNNYSSKIDTKVDKLHNGEIGSIIKGKGVIVGICDTGIDINHPDFKTENGTRIKYIWDMSDKSGVNHPLGYTWGREYNSSDINNESCKQTDLFGHGTHVSGIASGNGNGDIKYSGMAPEADIIMVKASYQQEAKDIVDDIDILAAINWIFKKADELDKPAVINLSFGHVFGPHDGSSLLSEGISNLSAPGKIIVASAGNTADKQVHTGTDFNAYEYYETVVVPVKSICNDFKKLCPDDENYYLTGCDLWYSANSIDSIFVSMYDYNNESKINTLLKTIGYGKNDVFKNDVININNKIYGYVDIDFTNNELPESSSGNTLVLIHNKSDLTIPVQNMCWSVTVKTNKTGRLDAWSAIPARIKGNYNILGSKGKQLFADSNMSISSPADGKRVICVGSYVTLNKVTYDDGFIYDMPNTLNGVSEFSSRGPTRDGRIVPTVLAPGQTIISALSGDKESTTAVSSYYINMSGTSMSSPAVAGIIALMLQVNPKLTFDDIVEILKATSRKDDFTGSLPNNKSGYGKINALAAIQRIINTNVDEYTQKRNSCYFYPNPASDYIEISGSIGACSNEASLIASQFTSESIQIFDMLGVVQSTSHQFASPQPSPKGDGVRIDVSSLAPGIYFIKIGNRLEKFVKM
jgi:subtilisin family serine protease